MTQSQLIQFNRIINIFKKCTQLQFSGQINIRDTKKNKWIFYYQLGKLVWATESTHIHRRLRRNLVDNCHDLDINSINFYDVDISVDYWDFLIIENLYKTQKITNEQINNIIEKTIFEVTCDLAQKTNSSSFFCEQNQDTQLEAPIISTSINILFQQIKDFWNGWSEAGLENFHPNLSPVLRNPDLLRRQVNSIVYNNFERLINGQHTLWDLAAKMKQNVVSVTRSLRPFMQKGITELIEIGDLPLAISKANHQSSYSRVISKNAPLIACIDDSPQVCKILERIITANGMRFIGIQDAVKALPVLIESKPDLIFLDLIMPVINGYELCSQLRSTSLFAKTPVIVLTGSDGVFDRVRSKVFGATEFITKPIDSDKVIGIVNRYLQDEPKLGKPYNLAFSY
ncbi:response regulator [Anabaena cylindrica FACHB-243]|uniref:Protein PatA n=1 Tax=Anabaena cylindrica (strain ATCC 27899 / PCC 7122) TaxID=272123 RepID=K9Z944_ANACC|nr:MULTISPECIES: response regulator [Anabaena]AFZ55681.1 response regulator receiver protein [Anabaena cylindrica PCC 7122]MBD2420311.1 response regulator [Anabaena cylindrica FACHB-243]MBY5282074.1 response regulator [Anabaena sp. CCAP 1446/1C]MBY5309628.1 response regulator [Anabaena sp. CCAP 1446/1C]MCM2406030.1 response regulator [Anabaena sp. CCAP 1446/1C]